eukprot:7142654-Pyramimonas_sp.AAC.1
MTSSSSSTAGAARIAGSLRPSRTSWSQEAPTRSLSAGSYTSSQTRRRFRGPRPGRTAKPRTTGRRRSSRCQSRAHGRWCTVPSSTRAA